MVVPRKVSSEERGATGVDEVVRLIVCVVLVVLVSSRKKALKL
jgi:hypothetical protein